MTLNSGESGYVKQPPSFDRRRTLSVRTIILNFDRLTAGSLGCYGGMCVDTPHFDGLASRSLTCDNYFITHTDRWLLHDLIEVGLPLLLLHNGQSPLASRAESLPPQVHVRTAPDLLRWSDEELGAQLAELRSAAPVDTDESILCLSVSQESLSGLALIQAAAGWLADEDLGRLSPLVSLDDRISLEEATALLKGLDRAPAEGSRDGNENSGSQTDSELDVGAALVAPLILDASQVIEQDWFLGRLLAALATGEGIAVDCLLVTASSGDPRASRSSLMEMEDGSGTSPLQWTPDWVRSISDVVAQLPLLIHLPRRDLGERCQELLQSADLLPLLTGIGRRGEGRRESEGSVVERLAGQREIVYQSASAQAIRDKDWLFIQRREPPGTQQAADQRDERGAYLFRKPEDAWELLDVADQYPELLEHLKTTGRLPFHGQ